MCAPDVDIDATQPLIWRVPYQVATLFTAVRETLRAKLRPESAVCAMITGKTAMRLARDAGR
jgi:hypothetical protein